MQSKTCKESYVVQTNVVLPNDLNNHDTLFGGQLMKMIDMIAGISAARHSRKKLVTASTDSIDFLAPIQKGDTVCLEAYVTWVGNSSIEVFVKIISENVLLSNRNMAATAFLTFVTIKENGVRSTVPRIIPESEEEIFLYETAEGRKKQREIRRFHSRELAKKVSIKKLWE